MANPGSVATWLDIHPRVPDFSSGFQSHLSAGTRSSTRLVFASSWSNSIISISLIGIAVSKLEFAEVVGKLLYSRHNFFRQLRYLRLAYGRAHELSSLNDPPLLQNS